MEKIYECVWVRHVKVPVRVNEERYKGARRRYARLNKGEK